MQNRPYQKLITWQESHNLCVNIYAITKTYPPDERYGLVSQMRRSASSVPTNIAEGNERRSPKDKAHFLTIAKASLEELHYQCFLSRDLNIISDEYFKEVNGHIQRISYLISKQRESLL